MRRLLPRRYGESSPLRCTGNATGWLCAVSKRITIFLITFLVLYMLVQLHQSVRSDKQLRDDSKISPEIHIALALDKEFYVRQFEVLLKNMMYYHGHTVARNSACTLSIKTIRNSECPEEILRPIWPLHFHLLVTKEVEELLKVNRTEWNIPLLSMSFYDRSEAASYTSHIPANSAVDRTSIMKIAWSEILPPKVKKVISMDCDILFNQDVYELWKFFDQFNENQVIGGVFEQTNHLRRTMASSKYPILKTGINAGLLLLHLERLRQIEWAKLWRATAKEVLSKSGYIHYVDQGLINTILYRNPQFLFEIPCQWNFIPKGKHIRGYCKLVWVVMFPHKENCLEEKNNGDRDLRLAGAVHYCSKPKPESTIAHYSGNPSPVTEYVQFSTEDVRRTYFEVYSAFKNLSISCFL